MSKAMKQVEPVPESEIIQRLKNKDEVVLKTLYKKHYQVIVGLVVNNGGSLQEAKDIYQDTIIIFLDKLKEPDFELNCSIKTFLYSVGRRIWLEQLRHKNKFNGVLQDTDEFIALDVDDALEKESQFKAMHLALESLGEPCRSIMKDFYLQNQSMDDIANKFGYTNTDNAKNQKYKCLKRLKKLFFGAYNNVETINNEES
jgi:hypothetical protein